MEPGTERRTKRERLEYIERRKEGGRGQGRERRRQRRRKRKGRNT